MLWIQDRVKSGTRHWDEGLYWKTLDGWSPLETVQLDLQCAMRADVEINACNACCMRWCTHSQRTYCGQRVTSFASSGELDWQTNYCWIFHFSDLTTLTTPVCYDYIHLSQCLTHQWRVQELKLEGHSHPFTSFHFFPSPPFHFPPFPHHYPSPTRFPPLLSIQGRRWWRVCGWLLKCYILSFKTVVG